MSQKKGVNLLVILSNLLDQRQQLTHQHQHQTRFGAGGHGISLQMGLVQPLDNRGGDRVGLECFARLRTSVICSAEAAMAACGVG